MRRLLPLAAVLALTPGPASAGVGQCVSSGGVTVCPSAVMRCTPGDTVAVRVAGIGTGRASCGGMAAECYSFRVTCDDTAGPTSSGILTCYADQNAVAYCSLSNPR